MRLRALELFFSGEYTADMRQWIPLRVVLMVMLIHTGMIAAAFEPAAESPLLQGGASSMLFPLSPLVLFSNPASLGLLNGSGVSASASRPFGLRRLDRTALAADWMFEDMVLGGALSLSGDGSYSECILNTSAAWKASPGLVLGLGASLRDLQISGYGRASGFSADAGAVWSPTAGIYSAISLRSFLRSSLGESGDPAAPKVLEFAVGAVPIDRIRIALGIGRQEGLGPEFSVMTSFIPTDAISLSAGLLTDPARFWATLTVSISSLDLAYGYGEHSTLPGSHFISLCYGSCASSPAPFDSGAEPDTSDAEPDFPLDVNSVTEEELIAIPGIGPGRAAAIRSWLDMNGPVTDIDMLDDIPGIGPSLLAVLREYLEVR